MDFTGVGFDVRTGPWAVNVRALPRGTSSVRLVPDLEIIGGWLTATSREIGFAQIGAFDGYRNDPLHDLIRRYGWKGILVEPQPDAFERLQNTYADVDGLVFLNAAVGEQRGSTPFYYVDRVTADDPWFFGQIASFDRDHVLSHLSKYPEAAGRIVSTNVPTIPLNDVLGQAPRPVDVLQIDAEGFDAKVVTSLDLGACRPTLVRFEHRHLSSREHQAAVSHLRPGGYRFAVDEDDTIALLHTPGRGASAID